MKRISKFSLLIALFAALMLAAGCEREVVQPAAPTLEGFKTDLSDTSMTEAEFKALYAKLEELAANPPAGTVTPQAALINRRFDITYGSNLAVGIGAAIYNRPTSEWLGGAYAGSTFIPGSVIDQLIQELPKRIRLVQVYEWYNEFLPIYQFQMIFEDQGNFTIWGLYDAISRNYVFLGGAGVANNSCGIVALGRIAGQLTPNGQGIIAGEYGYGLVFGCTPVVVAGTVGLTYTGVAIP